MSNFREAINTQAVARRSPSWAVVGTAKDVDYLTANDSVNAGRVVKTCARLIAETSEDEDTTQVCSYLLTIITSIFRDTDGEARDALRELGASPIVRVLPRDSGVTAIELEPEADPAGCLLIFAQAILIVFKNISTQRYDNFMRNRINAMRALLGMDPRLTVLRAFDYTAAHILHTRVGSCVKFRVAVMNTIIAEARNSSYLGKICSYLTTILAWSEMSALTFIVDALLVTKSPVLCDPRVRSEVNALAEAFSEINQFAYPQFYRIMKSPLECKKLERNRFPILFSVASKIRAMTHPTISQFVVSPTDTRTVEELVIMHTNATMPPPAAVSQMDNFMDVFNYLTDFTDERFAPVIEEVEDNPEASRAHE